MSVLQNFMRLPELSKGGPGLWWKETLPDGNNFVDCPQNATQDQEKFLGFDNLRL